MKQVDADRIEELLNPYGTVGGDDPYRHILKLTRAKGLSVGVLSTSASEIGHVHVHVWNVSPEEAWRIDRSGAPPVPGLRKGCPKCSELPPSYPAWYWGLHSGPNAAGKRPGKRRYFGFEWHTRAKPLLTNRDHAFIALAVEWLLDRFHR